VSYLLDTNVVSELRKRARCNANVARWHAGIPTGRLFTSVLVVGEIRRGIEKLRAQEPARAAMFEHWLLALAQAFGPRLLDIDAPVAEQWARYSSVRTVATVDGLLAATANVHGLTLVTRNTRDVRDLGIAVLNPFEHR